MEEIRDKHFNYELYYVKGGTNLKIIQIYWENICNTISNVMLVTSRLRKLPTL